MKNLEILVLKPDLKKFRPALFSLGEIRINDFKEKFDMPLEYWSIKDYLQQWEEGLERLNTHNESCLVTRIYDPNKDPMLEWWLLYKENGKIYIRNQVLFTPIYKKKIGNNLFTPETCYNFIQPKTPRINENGQKISEWVVDYKD
jgi:hypothetical protein